MNNINKVITIIVLLASMSSAQALHISFTINETDMANPTPHVHHADLTFAFDQSYGTNGVDVNGFRLIDYTTLFGTFTVPLPGNVDTPNIVMSVVGVAVGAFQGLPGQFNDNLFKYSAAGAFVLGLEYFSFNGLAFESTDGSHSYNIFQQGPNLQGCVPSCASGVLRVTDFSVPEPTSIALIALGLFGLGATRNKYIKSKK